MRAFPVPIKIVLLLVCLLGLSSCTATIAKEYGYSFSAPIDSSRMQNISCGESKYYFSNSPNYRAVISNSDASVIVTLDDSQKVHWILIGPSVLVPLPLIPWPFGIVNTLTESENPNFEKVAVLIHLQTKKEAFSFNPHLVTLKIASDVISPLKVTQYLKDSLFRTIQIGHSEYIPIPAGKSQGFEIVFQIPTPGTTEMELIPDGFMLNQAEMLFAPLKLYLFKGTRLYWITTINC